MPKAGRDCGGRRWQARPSGGPSLPSRVQTVHKAASPTSGSRAEEGPVQGGTRSRAEAASCQKADLFQPRICRGGRRRAVGQAALGKVLHTVHSSRSGLQLWGQSGVVKKRVFHFHLSSLQRPARKNERDATVTHPLPGGVEWHCPAQGREGAWRSGHWGSFRAAPQPVGTGLPMAGK